MAAPEPRETDVTLARVMETYRRAWETRDAELVAGLFTEDATYQENPFSPPLEGRAAIRHYWEEATRPHGDVQFRWNVVASQEALHVVEWRVEFTRADAGRTELRGVMFIELSGDRIYRFREYWLRRKSA